MAWNYFRYEEAGTWKRRNLAVLENDGAISFNKEELKTIQGFEIGTEYIEVGCGCTNKKYGDFIGKLKINDKGRFSITCECFQGCSIGKYFSIPFYFLFSAG